MCLELIREIFPHQPKTTISIIVVQFFEVRKRTGANADPYKSLCGEQE